MIDDKKGNVVILAGNNKKKTEYIFTSVNAGYHVLADKPMAIDANGFHLLEQAYDSAQTRGVYLYDIMTERYDIQNAIERELAKDKQLFGELQTGTQNDPAIYMESTHHYFKEVSGKVTVRPPWFYDIEQQGEGIVDVATHLVDLVNWKFFPDQPLDYRQDLEVLSATHWPTYLSLDDFKRSTLLTSYPDYLKKYVKGDTLAVLGNGTINYRVEGIHVGVKVLWNYEAPRRWRR